MAMMRALRHAPAPAQHRLPPDEILQWHPLLGIHAANIAPEYGVEESLGLLSVMEGRGATIWASASSPSPTTPASGRSGSSRARRDRS